MSGIPSKRAWNPFPDLRLADESLGPARRVEDAVLGEEGEDRVDVVGVEGVEQRVEVGLAHSSTPVPTAKRRLPPLALARAQAALRVDRRLDGGAPNTAWIPAPRSRGSALAGERVGRRARGGRGADVAVVAHRHRRGVVLALVDGGDAPGDVVDPADPVDALDLLGRKGSVGDVGASARASASA